jgi:hypothetical protein
MKCTVSRPSEIWSSVANVFAANVGYATFGRWASRICSLSSFVATYAAACAGSGEPEP